MLFLSWHAILFAGANPYHMEPIMKLLTKELEKKLPQLGENDEKSVPEEKVTAWVKLFTPDSNWTWWIAEYDPKTEDCYGLVEGLEKEFGYFNLKEIKKVNGPMGLPVERDRHFEPKPLTSCQ